MTDERIIDLKTVQSGALRTLVEVLKDVLNDVTLMFSEEGAKIIAMDGSHVALIHMFLEADRFELYKCKKNINVGLSMQSWYKLMKTVSNNDTVSMYISEGNTDQMGISIHNADKNSITNFHLKLLDIDDKTFNIPDVEINCIVSLPSHDFQRMCRDMSNISDTVEIVSRNDSLVFSCDGDFASQETVIGEAMHGLVFTKKDNESIIKGKFSLKYINLFTKSTNLCNTIELYLKNNYPLILKYGVANLGTVKFCLAPKTE